MDKDKLKIYKRKLISEKKDIIKNLNEMENVEFGSMDMYDTENAGYDNHPADIGTEVYMMERDQGFKNKLKDTLMEIDDSLKDVEEGSYGICNNCKKEIDSERLGLIPYLKVCIKCAQEIAPSVGYRQYDNNEELGNYFGVSKRDSVQTDREDTYQKISSVNIVENDPDVSVVAGGMSEDDVKYILKHPLSMVGSDGYTMKLGDGMPHPRSYRTFSRVLSKYVRDEEVISLEQAVMKMSYYAAWKLGIQDRGLIKPGFKADISIFDLWNIKSISDFGDPHHYSKGMNYVLTNGKFAIREEKFTEELSGCVLRKGLA